MITVYGITDEFGQIRYVGQTSRPHERYKEHRRAGKIPVHGMAILASAKEGVPASRAEQDWIEFFGIDNLFNKLFPLSWYSTVRYQWVDAFGRIKMCAYEGCRGRFIPTMKGQRCCTQEHQDQQDQLIRQRIMLMVRQLGVGK
jgi:hypothetical protein